MKQAIKLYLQTPKEYRKELLDIMGCFILGLKENKPGFFCPRD